MNRPILRGALAAVLLAAALALFGACDSDDDDHAVDPSAVLATITILDKGGLHDLDTALNTDRQIPASARTNVLHLQTATKVTRWPEGELSNDAATLADIFGELAHALDGDKPDIAAAGALAKKAHEAEHDFSHAAWEYLDSQAGLKPVTEGAHSD